MEIEQSAHFQRWNARIKFRERLWKHAQFLILKFEFLTFSTMDKRAHHNALERKRRDHIKDSFTGLRDAIPTMRGGDKSSRAQILKKASEYIQVCTGCLKADCKK